MKIIRQLILVILLGVCIFPNFVSAAGNISVSTTNLNITKGKTASFKITASNSAGKIDISTSNSSVASLSSSSLFLDMQSATVNVTGNTEGTATIKIYVTDATTYDDEDLSGKTYTINVNVKDPATNNVVTNNLSKNNNIKHLEVEGFNLNKIDNKNYTLTVNNSISNIVVNGTPEDSKAKISGTGFHELIIGENNIEVIVTSESGAKNKINIKVIRKDGYYLEDLDSLLNNSDIEDINIIIVTDSIISSEQINKIKDSGKIVKFNYYDESKKLIYSWSVNGNKIKNSEEILTTISYTSENSNEIAKLSNYADGIFINLKNKNSLPAETIIKIYVGDKFEDGNVVNLYTYNKKEQFLLKNDKISVSGGYIEFNGESDSEYFVTMSNIESSNKEEESSINVFMIIAIIELIVIISLGIFIFIKLKSKKKDVDISDNIYTNLE
ncbi:MAG: hypothetical protein IJO33_04140 [Bacilli bacterium]|nr:hypothetical protein [Bacilli bacterium]